MYQRYRVSNEALLETEKLLQNEAKAEAGTTQEFESFVKDTEKKAIAERDERTEEEDGSELEVDANNQTEDNQLETPEDGELTDAIPDEEDEEDEAEQVTNEAFHEWIRDKTEGSSSSIVRNAGALAAGLAHIGVKYGPTLVNMMYQGVLWSFSRLGTTLYKSSVWLKDHVEKSQLSLDKLENRLKVVQASIIESMNAGKEVTPYQYKNQKVIAYLKAGKSTDFAGLLRNFSVQLTKATGSLANEAETGVKVAEKLAEAGKSAKSINVDVLMEVSPPGQGFKKGTILGYEKLAAGGSMDVYHTEPVWPGDVTLMMAVPVVRGLEVSEISSVYGSSRVFMAPDIRSQQMRPDDLKALSGQQLIMVAKSTAMLLAACREVSKGHVGLLKLNPSISNYAQKLFYELADKKAKSDMEESLVVPLYLRSKFATDTVVKGSTGALTHASRVLSAAIQLLEDHAAKLKAGS